MNVWTWLRTSAQVQCSRYKAFILDALVQNCSLGVLMAW